MAHYSALIGRKLGLSDHFVDALLQAAPMHDVGKMGIPDHILLKPGETDPGRIRDHERPSQDRPLTFWDSSSPVLQLAASIALHHHENSMEAVIHKGCMKRPSRWKDGSLQWPTYSTR